MRGRMPNDRSVDEVGFSSERAELRSSDRMAWPAAVLAIGVLSAVSWGLIASLAALILG